MFIYIHIYNMSVLNNYYYNQNVLRQDYVYIFLYMCVHVCVYVCICVCICVQICVCTCVYVCVCVCTRKKIITRKEIILHRSCSIDRLCMCMYVLYGIKDACLSVLRFYDPFLLKRPSQQPSQWPSQQPSQKNKKARFSYASRISLMLGLILNCTAFSILVLFFYF